MNHQGALHCPNDPAKILVILPMTWFWFKENNSKNWTISRPNSHDLAKMKCASQIFLSFVSCDFCWGFSSDAFRICAPVFRSHLHLAAKWSSNTLYQVVNTGGRDRNRSVEMEQLSSFFPYKSPKIPWGFPGGYFTLLVGIKFHPSYNSWRKWSLFSTELRPWGRIDIPVTFW